MTAGRLYVLVEEEPQVAAFYSRLVANWGFSPVIVESYDVISYNKQHKPSVLHLDGLCFDLFETMMRDNPLACYMLISGSTQYEEKAKEIGVQFFLKPVPNKIIKAHLDFHFQVRLQL